MNLKLNAWATLGLVLLLASPAWAAPNAVRATDVVITSDDGAELQFVPRSDLVKIVVTLNNTAATPTNGTLGVRVQITHEDGTVAFNQTVRQNVDLAAGESTTITINWPPSARKLGNHSLSASVEESTAPAFPATFTVTETAVEAGNYAERIVRYSWFFGLFLIAIVLFIVVLAARRA